MLNLFFLNTITPTAADVTFVSQNIAASNLSPYEYKNKENLDIIKNIYKYLENQIMIMPQPKPEAKDDDKEKKKFDDLYQPLICAYQRETTLMSVNYQDINDAIIKISGESENLIFPGFLEKYKIEGDDVFTDRPAVPFDAETLSTRLNAGTEFGDIFVEYLKKAELENAPKSTKLKEKEEQLEILDKKSTEYIKLKDEIDMLKDDIKTFETSKDKSNPKYQDASGKFLGTPKNIIAERIVLLFIYDYYFYVAASTASSKWLDDKIYLDDLMKNARNTAVSNILEKGYDLIALQEADQDDVLAKTNVNMFPVKYKISNFLTKKGKSSIIIYNQEKFEFQNVIDLGDFRTKKGEAVCASLKCLDGSLGDKAVFVCSYHSGGDGLETPVFLDLIGKLAAGYEHVLIGLDGNVLLEEVREQNKLKKLGFPMFTAKVAEANLTITFGSESDLTNDVAFARDIDFIKNQIDGFSMARDITNDLVWLTTSKERSDLQTQRVKANKPDKNPKDHILSRGFKKTNMKIFNTHKDSKFEYVKNQRMPNETFAADHALIFGSFTPLTPEHQSIYPHSSASADQVSADD